MARRPHEARRRLNHLREAIGRTVEIIGVSPRTWHRGSICSFEDAIVRRRAMQAGIEAEVGFPAAASVRLFGATVVQVRWALATIFMILAIAFVMNWSGQTTTLGRFLAGAGPAYAILSPVIGWIGVVVTGSDNSTNALFGHLQVVAAKETGISPNSSCRVQHHRRGTGENALSAEPRNWRRCGWPHRPRRRDFP